MNEALQVELDTAKKSAKQAAESAQYAINTCASGDRSLAENAIERGMAKSMEAMNHMAKALTIINECGHESSPYEPYEEAQTTTPALPINMQTMVDFEDSGAIRCVFLTPPMTKSRAAANRFFEIFCVDLQKKIVANMPQNFRKIEDAYVFFIHHFDETDPHKQPYFDNDNLAIKSIFDSVLPFVCFDDASCYCSNLYLSQPDSRDYSELVVIQKSRAKQWILQRTDLQFSRDFL